MLDDLWDSGSYYEKGRIYQPPMPEPIQDRNLCARCGRIAIYVWDGRPYCLEHLPREAREAATRVG